MTKGLRVLPALTMLLGWLLFPGVILASGIGVNPGSLDVEAYPLMKAQQSIAVTNTSSEEGYCQVYAEGEVREWLSISPEEFVLGPGDSQVVEIAVRPPLGARGDYEATICAVSLAPVSELKIGCGIKVPIHIAVGLAPPIGKIAELAAGSPVVWLITAISLAIAVPLIVRRRRKHREA